jgi:hypothetical protein
MVTHQEIRLRQFIWSEFRSGKTDEEAIAKLDSVSAEMIDTWYAHFQSGKTSIFDNNIVSAIQTLPTGEEVSTLKYKYKTLYLEGSHSIFRVCF